MEAISDCRTLDEVIERVYGNGVSVAARKRVAGGDINEAYLLQLSDGSRVFLKENAKENIGFFSAETEGLAALAGTRAIGVPTAHAYGIYGEKAFLLMESLEQGPMARDFWERFGHDLADMHKADTTALLPEKKFGFRQDNYIGAGYQKNTAKDSWVEFFRDCRLLQPGYEDRRDIYNLYHMLNHLNLFGSSYLYAVERIVSRY